MEGLTDENADFAEAGVEDLVFLVSGAEIVFLGPPQIALLVPADDLSVPVDIRRDVLQDRSSFRPLLARLVVLDFDLAFERFPVLVDGAFDNGTDDDVDFDLFCERLEGREPVLGGGGIGIGGSVQVSVRVRVLREVPVLGFADNSTQLSSKLRVSLGAAWVKGSDLQSIRERRRVLRPALLPAGQSRALAAS